MNAPERLPLTVSLQMPADVQPLLVQSLGAVELANAFEIDCAEVAQAAQDQRIAFKKINVVLEAKYKGYVAPAQAIIAQARADWKPAIEANEQAYAILGTKLLKFQEEETARVAAENRAREEAERKARQEAEQKAAAERARAEEVQRQKQEQANREAEARARAEAEARAAAADRQRAIDEGNKEAAREAAERERKAKEEAQARAAAEAKANEQARTVVDNAEAAAQTRTMEAAASKPAPAATVAKIAGLSARENWIAELAPGKTEDDAKLAIITAIAAGRPELASLLKLDLSAANKLAKALKTNANIPGMICRNAPIAASRGK